MVVLLAEPGAAFLLLLVCPCSIYTVQMDIQYYINSNAGDIKYAVQSCITAQAPLTCIVNALTLCFEELSGTAGALHGHSVLFLG